MRRSHEICGYPAAGEGGRLRTRGRNLYLHGFLSLLIVGGRLAANIYGHIEIDFFSRNGIIKILQAGRRLWIMATINDIAKMAGVSASTVSHVVNKQYILMVIADKKAIFSGGSSSR